MLKTQAGEREMCRSTFEARLHNDVRNSQSIERVRNALTLMGRLAGCTTTVGVLFWTLERGGNKDLDISLIQRFPGHLK